MKLLKTSAALDRLQLLEAELSSIKIGLSESTWEDNEILYNIEKASVIEKEIKLIKLIIKLDNDDQDC